MADLQKRKKRLISAPEIQNRYGILSEVSHREWRTEKRHSYVQQGALQHTEASSKQWRVQKHPLSGEECQKWSTGCGLDIEYCTADIMPDQDLTKDLKAMREENEKLKNRLEKSSFALSTLNTTCNQLTEEINKLLARNKRLLEFVEYGMGDKGGADITNVVDALVAEKQIESLQAELQAKLDTESSLQAIIEDMGLERKREEERYNQLLEEKESQKEEIRRIAEELRTAEYDIKTLNEKISDLREDKEFLSSRIQEMTLVIAGNIEDTEKTLTALKGVLDDGAIAWKQDFQKGENEKFQKFLCYGNGDTINYSVIRVTADKIDEDWEVLGRYLHLEFAVLAKIEANNDKTEDKAIQMLAAWYHMNQEEASLGTLKNALERIPRNDIADEICDMSN